MGCVSRDWWLRGWQVTVNVIQYFVGSRFYPARSASDLLFPNRPFSLPRESCERKMREKDERL
jgi:hypothetical protein